MSFFLWIDDQHDCPDTPSRHPPEGYIGAASTEEAKALVMEHGLITACSLDHDLGQDDTVMKFLKWYVYDYGALVVPSYTVHSQNPIGRANIISFMESWKKSMM